MRWSPPPASRDSKTCRPAPRVGTSSLRRQAQLPRVAPGSEHRVAARQCGHAFTQARRGRRSSGSAATNGGAWTPSCSPARVSIRLGLESRITARLDPEVCLPAVTQGVIGIECRQSDPSTRALLRALEDPATRRLMDAERAFAARLGGSCQSPIAAYAELEAERITLRGLVAEPDGSRLLRELTLGQRASNRLRWDASWPSASWPQAPAPLLERLRAT